MHPPIAFRILGFTLAVVVTPPDAASTQTVEITPSVGAFFPVADLLVEEDFSGRHTTGLAGGLRLTYQTTGRLGFSVGATYAESDFAIEDEGLAFEASGHVLAFSGTARYRLAGMPSGIQPHIAGGVAVLTRGGQFYDEFEWSGTTDVGGMIGVGIELPVGDRLRMAVDVADFISSASVQEGSLVSESRIQNDIAVTVGLTVPLWSGTR